MGEDEAGALARLRTHRSEDFRTRGAHEISAAPLFFNPDLQAAFEAELPPEAALVLCPKAELGAWIWR